jgi:hypothetical protein
VTIEAGGGASTVRVHRRVYNGDEEAFEPNPVWSCENAARVFIGEHYGEEDVEWARGNSILVCIGMLRYCYIGSEIYEFTAPEEITAYYSKVGNSGVPYPIAYSATSFYLMLDHKFAPTARLGNDVELWDAYGTFYGWPQQGNGDEMADLVVRAH